MITLENNNGSTYELMAMCGYNKADREYYKYDVSHISAYALLRMNTTGITELYVVASGLTRYDWGNGAYFDDLEEAQDYYKEKVAEYFGE